MSFSNNLTTIITAVSAALLTSTTNGRHQGNQEIFQGLLSLQMTTNNPNTNNSSVNPDLEKKLAPGIIAATTVPVQMQVDLTGGVSGVRNVMCL